MNTESLLRTALGRLLERFLIISGEPASGTAPHEVTLAREALAARPHIDAHLRNSERYERLRIIGAAPCGTQQLENGTVLRCQNLDAFIDADLAAHVSRGEFRQDFDRSPDDIHRTALHNLAHIEAYLSESDARAEILNRAVDVRLAIKELFVAARGYQMSADRKLCDACDTPDYCTKFCRCARSSITDTDVRMLYAVAAHMTRDGSPRCAADLRDLAERVRTQPASGSDGTAAGSDAEEATKLQTLLAEEFDCYRTAQGGLYAWAMNALLDSSPHQMGRIATSGSELAFTNDGREPDWNAYAAAEQAATCQPPALTGQALDVVCQPPEGERDAVLRLVVDSMRAEAARVEGVLRAEISSLKAALAHPPTSIDQQGGAPAEYQFRTKPDWDEKHPWTEWTRCTEGQYQDYKRMPCVNNWLYETRALYVSDSDRTRWLEEALRDFIKYADDCNDDSPELDRAREALAAAPAPAAQADQDALRYRLVRSLLSRRAFDHCALEGESGDEIDSWVDAAMSQAKGADPEAQPTVPPNLVVGVEPADDPTTVVIAVHVKEGDQHTVLYSGRHPIDKPSAGAQPLLGFTIHKD